MADYKAEITLNEKDSLQDLLTQEKDLLKFYSYAITEGCSNGFRKVIKNILDRVVELQIKTFFLMTERGYYEVTSATHQEVEEVKNTFNGMEKELY